MNAPASWSAVAERSGDTAFILRTRFPFARSVRPAESGVALRFPAALHDAKRIS